jgi:hypothetical protein
LTVELEVLVGSEGGDGDEEEHALEQEPAGGRARRTRRRRHIREGVVAGRVHRRFITPAPGPSTAALILPPGSDHRRSGYEILVADLSAVAFMTAGVWAGSRTDSAAVGAVLAVPGGLLYLGGGPAVHLFGHDRPGGAGRSALPRVLAPVGGALALGGIAAASTRPGTSDICTDRRACAAAFGGVAGFGLGMLGEMVADWVTARERPEASSSPGLLLVLAPTLLPSRRGGGLALQGTF